jgi:lactate dehydrogenase-like 2-hydroxyacid dehydrogenase
MQPDRKLLVVAPIPLELRQRLEGSYELVEHGRDTAGGPAPGYRVAVTTSAAGATAELMAALPDLGLIACNGAGLERIDLAAAARRGIAVRNTPGVVTEDTADGAIGLIYALVRRIVEADRFVRAGRWAGERMAPSRRLTGMSVGIVGLGRIGQAVAARAAALGLAVSYTGPRRKPEVPFPFVATVAELAGAVDILVLSCPGGERTRNLVDAGVLQALGPDGYVVNVARGSVVDQEALIGALSRGEIAGAALDVFAAEPDIDPRLPALENVVLQPHYAAVTRQTREDIADVLAEAIEDFLAGRPVADAAATWQTAAG